MKFIEKGESPEEFESWKIRHKPTSWGSLTSPFTGERVEGTVYYSKSELRTVLYQEQNGLCCYCNAKISNDNMSPIDHIEPREGDTRAERIFDYNNLVLSCNGGQKENTNPKVLYCDAKKGSSSISLTPLMRDCETEISFTENGEIVSRTERAITTIETLNLHHIYLNNRRNEAIIPYIYSDIESKEPSILLTYEEIQRNLEIIQNNHDIGYWSAINSVLRGYM